MTDKQAATTMTKLATITDPSVIETLCMIQRDFVEAWNKAEMNDLNEQTHDLPGGATYSGGGSAKGACFFLPDGTAVEIICKAPWRHWHDGWSFCRNPIAFSEVKKVTVRGSIDAFNEWFSAVNGRKSLATN